MGSGLWAPSMKVRGFEGFGGVVDVQEECYEGAERERHLSTSSRRGDEVRVSHGKFLHRKDSAVCQ